MQCAELADTRFLIRLKKFEIQGFYGDFVKILRGFLGFYLSHVARFSRYNVFFWNKKPRNSRPCSMYCNFFDVSQNRFCALIGSMDLLSKNGFRANPDSQ